MYALEQIQLSNNTLLDITEPCGFIDKVKMSPIPMSFSKKSGMQGTIEGLISQLVWVMTWDDIERELRLTKLGRI